MGKLKLQCSRCGKDVEVNPTTAGNPRPPRGWKWIGEGLHCAECVQSGYVIRAVEFPVAGPVNWEWSEARESVLTLWEQSTQCANYAVTELARADRARTPRDKMLPAMPRDPKPTLYVRAADLFPGLYSKTVSSIVDEVRRKYLKARLRSRWLFTERLPETIFPAPCPFHNQSWKARWAEHAGTDGHVSRVPVIELPLGGRRRELRLRGGPEFRRQLAGFAQLVSGGAIRGQLVLRGRSVRDGDPRSNGLVIGRNSGREKERKHYLVMAKLVGHFPRVAPQGLVHTMLVRTDPHALWVAEIEGHAPWILNADHVLRWQAANREQYARLLEQTQHRQEAHKVFLQRVGEDLKFEKRWPRRKRDQINVAVERRCRKHADRIDSACKEFASLLAGYALRRKVSKVFYDDENKSYMPSFAWHQLKTALNTKLEGLGITMNDHESDKGE